MSAPVSPDWTHAPPWANWWTWDGWGCTWWEHEPALWGGHYVSRRAFDLDLLRSKWRHYSRTPGPRRIAPRGGATCGARPQDATPSPPP